MSAKTEYTIVIALGTNVNQLSNIDKAKALLEANFKSVSFSRGLWTEPIGLEGSDKFLNMVAVARTSNVKTKVLAALKFLENQCGRKRSGCKRGIVAMDLDLLLYGDEVCHPGDWEREYIKELMKEMERKISDWYRFDRKQEELRDLKVQEVLAKRKELFRQRCQKAQEKRERKNKNPNPGI